MKTFFISDTHFGHKLLVDLTDARDFNTTDEMDEYIIKQWNDIVSDEDRIYHLGDVSLGSRTHYKNNIEPRLNGKIIYIKGNHDNHKITSITHLMLVINGYEIELVHDPNNRTGCTDYVIHGHIHSTGSKRLERLNQLTKSKTKFFNVNLEFNDYKPVELQTVMNKLLGDVKC